MEEQERKKKWVKPKIKVMTIKNTAGGFDTGLPEDAYYNS